MPRVLSDVARSLVGLSLLLLTGAAGATARSPQPTLPHQPAIILRHSPPLFPQSPVPAPPVISLPQLEREIFEQVNRYRRERGLSPLRLDPRVSVEARAHSQAMAARQRSVGHGDFRRRVRRVNRIVASRRIAENVAYIFTHREPANRAVQGWLRSPKHRDAIEGDYRVTGVGVAMGERGSLYFTQIYIRPR